MTTTSSNNPRPRIATLAGAGVSLALVLLGGCRRDRGAAYGEKFPSDGEPRRVDRFVQVQSAAAARADATLTAHHFDGRGALNSLGRQKLDLMLRDDDASQPLVVYLDLAAGASAAQRGSSTGDQRENVRIYLVDRGVPESQVELRTGPNLAYSHPAADGLRGLRRFEGDVAPNPAPDAATPGAPAKMGAMNQPGVR